LWQIILKEKHNATAEKIRMPSAYVLITAETGQESDVLENLKKIEEIDEVCLVYGVYDIVAKATAESTETLRDVITLHIRKLNKVRNTLTMIITED
jgi:DNA-binding Lrp family transcriptional regulator